MFPTYDPWVVYGRRWWCTRAMSISSLAHYVSFGFGYPIGFFPYPWGWGFWGCNWGDRFVVFNHARFFSHSHTFFDHGHGFAHGGDFHGRDFWPRDITSTIEPIVDLLRRTWRGAATPAHSVDSTTVAWSNHAFLPRPVQFRRRYAWRRLRWRSARRFRRRRARRRRRRWTAGRFQRRSRRLRWRRYAWRRRRRSQVSGFVYEEISIARR